jgi:D-glycero-alpha-D-manno-heptose 1-phosphate guanylyltransferase
MTSAPSCNVLPIILAGGKGTRIATLHPGIPKPVVPVLGTPFVCHLFQQLADAGFEDVVVSIGYEEQKFRSEISRAGTQPLRIHFVAEEQPLGTGGAAAFAARSCGVASQKYLVMNGDSYLGGGWPEQLRNVTENQACILSRWVTDVSRYGALEFENDKLTGFREKSEEGSGWINAGIYLLPRDWLTGLTTGEPFSLEKDVLPQWLAEQKAIRVAFEWGEFLDIGTPETLRMADDFFENRLQKRDTPA